MNVGTLRGPVHPRKEMCMGKTTKLNIALDVERTSFGDVGWFDEESYVEIVRVLHRFYTEIRSFAPLEGIDVTFEPPSSRDCFHGYVAVIVRVQVNTVLGTSRVFTDMRYRGILVADKERSAKYPKPDSQTTEEFFKKLVESFKRCLREDFESNARALRFSIEMIEERMDQLSRV